VHRRAGRPDCKGFQPHAGARDIFMGPSRGKFRGKRRRKQMIALAEGFRALGTVRLLSMGAVALCLMVLLAVLALRGTPEQLVLLYADLDTREAGQIVDQLDRQRVPYQVTAGGTQIMVPSGQVAKLRVQLAKDGLPSGGSIGYEIFDRGDGLTTSQFQQKIAESRALEGELSRTIRVISGIRAARVHLVMPKREPFARERQDAQASVMVTMAGNGRLDREAVQSILNLVAGAVPGLRAKNIAVIDSKGNLLARAGEPTGSAAAAQGTEEIRRTTELRLSRAVEEMLERSLGTGRVRAEIAAEMDFERVQETQEKFDPEGQVVRSTQSVTGNTKSTEATPGVSVQNNLPNADASTAQAGSQDQRADETTNYEIGKTVRTLVREQPQIRRLSVAVLVDGSDDKGADGVVAWRPRTPEELERIARLVRSAVGYDEKRGDKVEVVNMRFTGEDSGLGAEPRGLFGMVFEKSDIMRLAQILLFGVVGVVALLVVFRPIVNRLTLAPALAGMLAGPGGEALAGLSAGALGADAMRMLEAPAGAARLAGPGGGTEGEEDSMVDLSNIEGQLRASSIRRLSELVSKHPEESLSIVRSWMQEGNS
jgi:flagellar M-ring protein FliF